MRGAVGALTFQRDLVAESLFSLKVTVQAMVLSFEHGFRVVAFSMALGVVLIVIMRRPMDVGPIDGVH